jgi:hypothetical protein
MRSCGSGVLNRIEEEYEAEESKAHVRPGHAGEKHVFHDWKTGVDSTEKESALSKRRVKEVAPNDKITPSGLSLLLVCCDE